MNFSAPRLVCLRLLVTLWFVTLALPAFAESITATVGSARPQSTRGLQITTIAERRVVRPSVNGPQLQFVPAAQLHIGDEIFYTLRVRNATDADIAHVVVIKEVPGNTRYVADSAVGPGTDIEFSTDGGASFVAADRIGDIATVTNIRWEMHHPLAAGATALLRFRGVFY